MADTCPHTLPELPGRAFNVRFIAIAESLRVTKEDDMDELLSNLPPDHKKFASSERVRYFKCRVRRAFKRMQADTRRSHFGRHLLDYNRDTKNLENCRRALEEKRRKLGRNREIDKLITGVREYQLEMADEADELARRMGKLATADVPVSRLKQAKLRLKRAKAEFEQAKLIIRTKYESS